MTKSEHPWSPAYEEFWSKTVPILEEHGLEIGKRANDGDSLCKEIISTYGLLAKSFDPVFYLQLTTKLDEYLNEGVEININGKTVKTPRHSTYEDIVKLDGGRENVFYTVVWSVKRQDQHGKYTRSGSLTPGEKIQLEPGMYFSIAWTGGA